MTTPLKRYVRGLEMGTSLISSLRKALQLYNQVHQPCLLGFLFGWKASL